MKIIIDLPKNLNKKLKFYKLKNDYVALPDALIGILERFFKVKADDK
jgi:hypothetical protein